MNTNIVIVAGRLTRDAELRTTPGGKSVAEVSIANNRKFKTEAGEECEETLFMDVTIWGRSAEATAEFCKTGSPVLVTGRLSLDSWEDKDSGEQRRKLRIVADRIDFLEPKPVQTDPPARKRDRPSA